MNVLLSVLKLFILILSLPFKAVGWLVLKIRGDEELPSGPEVDESYDFDEAQSGAAGLDYNVQGYENHEIGNERGWKPLQDDSELVLDKEGPPQDENNILLDHHALFVRHEGRQVLVVDYELPDIPSWLEYQPEIGHFTIVMMNGAVAHIDLRVEASYLADLEEESRILLVTSGDNEKIVHHLMFMLK